MSKEPKSFSAAFLLSMNCPSGIELGFRMRYLKLYKHKIITIIEQFCKLIYIMEWPDANQVPDLDTSAKEVLFSPALVCLFVCLSRITQNLTDWFSGV